ncbi:MAG: formylglycine-generating enzyme family protein, partial [Saprospiraceae bacterium]
TEKATRLSNGEPISCHLHFSKKTIFNVDFVLSDFHEGRFILSIVFKEEGKKLTLINKYFIPWTLKVLQMGGKILDAQGAYLVSEDSPDSDIRLSLKNIDFSIKKYPLMFWFPSIRIPKNLKSNIDFVQHILEDKSCYFLPKVIKNDFIRTHSEKRRAERSDEDIIKTYRIHVKREVIRNLIQKNAPKNEEILKLIKSGLVDGDWELRMSSIIACVRLGIFELLPFIKKVVLPKSTSSGLDKEELNIMVGIKYVSIDILMKKIKALPITKMPETPKEKKQYLANCLLARKIDFFHDAFLLIKALSTPIPEWISPKEMPACIIMKNRKYYLKKSGIELVWIPKGNYWLGSSKSSRQAIRMLGNPKGFFMGKNLVRQSDNPKECGFHQALDFCEKLSKLENTPIQLPSHSYWEMAARGKNGRHYPWGLSYEKGMLELESPLGLKECVGRKGEWTVTADSYIVKGANEHLRCFDEKDVILQSESSYSFRIMVSNWKSETNLR